MQTKTTLEQAVVSTRTPVAVLEAFLQYPNLIVPYEEALAANIQSERLGLDFHITREILRWGQGYRNFSETCANYENGHELETLLYDTLISHYPKPTLRERDYLKFDLRTALENVTRTLTKPEIVVAFSPAELKTLLEADLQHNTEFLFTSLFSYLHGCPLDLTIKKNKNIVLSFASIIRSYDKERYIAACHAFQIYCVSCVHYSEAQYHSVLDELTEKKENLDHFYIHLTRVFAYHLPEYFAPDKKAQIIELIEHILKEQCFCDMEDSLLELLAKLAKFKPEDIDTTEYFKHIISALAVADKKFNIHAKIAYDKLTNLVTLGNSQEIITGVSVEQLGHNIANADVIALKMTLSKVVADQDALEEITALCIPLTNRHSDKNILDSLLKSTKNVLSPENIATTIALLRCLNELQAQYQDKMNLRLFFHLAQDTALPLLERCIENKLDTQYLLTKLNQYDRFLRKITSTTNGELRSINDSLAYINYAGWDIPMSFFKEVLNKLHLIKDIDSYSEEKIFNFLEMICRANIRAISLTYKNMGIVQDFDFMATVIMLNTTQPDFFAEDNFNKLATLLRSMVAYAKHNASVIAHNNQTRPFTQAYQKLQALFAKHPEVIDQLQTLAHIGERLSWSPSLMIKKYHDLEIDSQTINAILDPIVTVNSNLLFATRERVDDFISTMLRRLESSTVQHLEEGLPMSVLCLLDEGFDLKHLMARCFSTIYASIATFEPDEYQFACEQIQLLFDGYSQVKTRSRIIFAEAVILPILQNSDMSLANPTTWKFLQHVRHKIERLSSDETKVQVFLRHFVRKIITEYSYAQTVLQNFNTIEAIFGELKQYPAHTINAICTGILSDLLIERPELFRDTSTLINTIRSAAKVFVSLEELNIKEKVVALFSTSDPLNANNFFKMVCRINRNLIFTEESAEKLTTIFKKIRSLTELKKLKLILQYNDDLDDIYDIIDKEFMLPSQRPSRQNFVCLKMTEQISWLKYYAIMRVRDGLGMLSYVLKHVDSYPESAVVYMLRGFNRIRLPLSNKKVDAIKSLLKHDSIAVCCEAVKALCAIDQNPDNKAIKQLLLNEFIATDIHEYQLVILETLTYYHFDQSDFATLEQIVEKSRAENNQELLKQYALTLSCIPFEAGLLRSLQIVNSDVWQEYDYCEHYHERDYRGSFIMFLHRPHWADNRPLMHRRIKRLLAQTQTADISLASIPSEIAKQAEELSDRISHCVPGNRYENVQFELPEATVLLRGLGDRHGAALEKQAVVDFLMKGSGSLELQGQADDQASHAASNNIYSGNNIREVSNYWDQNNGILMAIKASYFNRESQRGFTRTQREFGRHFIFLRGVPLWAIERAFLPESYRYTIEQLLSNVRTAELQNDPQFLFNHLDKHRLNQLKHSLKDFHRKIVFVNSNDNIYQLLQDQQLTVATDAEILHHTVHMNTQSEITAKESYPDKWQYESQDQERSVTQLFETAYFDKGIDRERVKAMIKEYFPSLGLLRHSNTLEKIFTAIEADSSTLDGMTDRNKQIHFFFLLFRFAGKSKRLYQHTLGSAAVLHDYNLNLQSKAIARYYLAKKASLLNLKPEDIDAVVVRIDQFHTKRRAKIDVLTVEDATFKQRAKPAFKHYFTDIFATLEKTRNTHGRDEHGTRINIARHTLETITGRDTHVGLQADGYSPKVRKLLRLALFLHDAGKDDRSKTNHLFEQHLEYDEPQTVCVDYFAEMTMNLRAPIRHKQHVFASLLIARRALLLQQEGLQISHDDIDLISMIIVHNDLFGRYFQHRIDFEKLQATIQEAFARVQQLPEFQLSEIEFIQMLYSVYFADAGTVSDVRRNFGPLIELKQNIMQANDTENLWDSIQRAIPAARGDRPKK